MTSSSTQGSSSTWRTLLVSRWILLLLATFLCCKFIFLMALPETSLAPIPQKIQKIRAPAWSGFGFDNKPVESWESTTDDSDEDDGHEQHPTFHTNEMPEAETSNDDSFEQEDETPMGSLDQTTAQGPPERQHKQLLIHGGYRRHPQFPSLHLLGERHTGTNWMTRHLEDCFSGIVDIVLGYSDWKHWFQFEEGSLSNASVVVAQFRNIYHWTEAMRFNPYHSPNHFNLGWKEFLTEPWVMDRYGEDLDFVGVNISTSPNITCKWGTGFRHPFQIIPCLANQTFVIPEWNGRMDRISEAYYELHPNGSGTSFDSILQMRATKIRNFLSMENFTNVTGFYAVRYEVMARNGTDWLISQLEKDLGVRANCTPIQGTLRKPRPLSNDYLDYMKQVVDWEAEALIGYYPDDL